MTREERVAWAYGLRYVGGLSLRAIADELGVPHGTVQRWLNPERIREQDRAAKAKRTPESRQAEYDKARVECACGQPMSAGSKQCLACYRSSLAVVERPIEPQALRGRVELDEAIYAAWHQGLADGSSPKEIAFSVGVTQAVLMTHVGLMRQAGRDLPRRVAA